MDKTINQIKTTLYMASAEELKDPDLFELGCQLVSLERRQGLGRIRFPKDKRLSLAAELLLRKALVLQGYEAEHLSFRRGPYGKPYLQGEQMPFFNLSHSGSKVLCALSPREIGCDIEKIGELKPRLAEKFFCPSEAAWICAAEEDGEKCRRFYRIWTLKESMLKACGRGMQLALNAFEVKPGERDIPDSIIFEGQRYYFREIDAIPDYRISVCGLHEQIAAPERIDFAETTLSI